MWGKGVVREIHVVEQEDIRYVLEKGSLMRFTSLYRA